MNNTCKEALIAAIFLVLLMILEGTSGMLNRPRDYTKFIPICNDRSIQTTQCILPSMEPLNWMNAHNFCRSQSGFLPKAEEMPKVSQLPGIMGTEIWSALINEQGVYQWITRYPAIAQNVSWEGGKAPEIWESKCSTYSRTSSRFTSSDCQKKFPFHCIVDRKLEEELSENLELVVSSNFKSAQPQWIEVTVADFNEVKLECSTNVIDRSSKQIPIFWTKDDIFVYTNNITLSLANIDNAMNSNTSLNEHNTKEVFLQGTYCCETWNPYSSQTTKSNCVLVTLNNVTTLQVTAVIEKEYWDVFKNGARFTEMSVANLHGNEIRNNNLTYVEFKFYAFVWNLNSQNGRQIHSEYKKNISGILSIVGSIKNISLATYCLDQVTSLDYGNNLSFPFARGGHIYNSPYKCVTKENQQVFAKCQWNFTDGARISFWGEQTCVRNEKCPKGFKTIGGQVCVKIIRNVNWEEGHTQLHQTGNERTLLDDSEYLTTMKEGKSLHRHIIDYLKNETITELWLPLRRKYHLTPIVDHSFNHKTSPFVLFKNNTSSDGMKWAQGHPSGYKICLAFNIKEGSLFTDDCHKKYNYAMIVDLVTYENDSITNENIVPPNLSLCEDSWHRVPVSAREHLCIKKIQSETHYLRKDAEMSCESQGAHLAFPGRGFMDWMFRALLNESEISWMILESNTSNVNFDFINWLPDTNFSKKYGIMSNEGWTMVDEDSAKIDIAICEKKVSIEQQHLKLSIKYYSGEQENTEVGNLLCVRAEPEHLLKNHSLKCFHNGAEVNLNLKKLDHCQFSLNIEGQGHYECAAWSNFPIEHIWSNVLKHVDSKSLTYIVIGQDNSQEYFPLDFDSTFYMKEGNAIVEPYCLSLVKKLITNENVSIAQSYFYKNNTGEFNYVFHLVCTKANSLLCGSEADTIKALRNFINIDINSARVCSVEYIRSSTGCISEKTSLFNKLFSLTWPTTESAGIFLPKELCIDSEGQPGNRLCIGNFIEGFYWEIPPQACDGEISNITKDIWRIYNDTIGYMNGSYQSNISELTKESNRTTVADFVYVASAMQKFAKIPNVAKKLPFQDVVSTMNNMMGARNSIMNSANEKFNSTSILLDAFETLAFLTYSSNEGSTSKESRDKLLVEILNISKMPSTIGYEISDSTKLLSSVGQIDHKQLESAVIFPRTLSKLVKNGKLMFAVYETDSLFYDQASNASGYVVSSQIIQVSFQKNLVPNLNGENITLIFRPKNDGEIFTCVFWDFSRNTGKGGWSSNGCTFIGIAVKLVTCECNHLSHYAILFQSQDKGIIDRRHISILIWISNIGCSLSIFGLVMVLTTFVLFKAFRQSRYNKILANLSLAILMSMLIFLTGIDQTRNVTLCRSVAVSLHYFILASFCWMLIVAIHQYFKLVKVFGTYIPRFVWKSIIFAWGVPVIPIVVILITDIGLYDYDNEDEKICWMSYTALKYSFVPPVAITLFFNAITYAIIINKVILNRNGIQSTQDERKVLITQISMAICVFILLGFTWIFGILSFLIENITFSYLFCIFNTIQGFFIFIFHLYRNQEGRKLWSNFTNGIRIRPRVILSNLLSQNAPDDGSQLVGESSVQAETNN